MSFGAIPSYCVNHFGRGNIRLSSEDAGKPRKDEMELPDTSFTSCPIDFLCSTTGPAWAAWVFMAWIVLMVTVGLVGAILVSRQ